MTTTNPPEKSKPMPVSKCNGKEARDNAVRVARRREGDLHNLCLRFVRQCWELPALYPSAKVAWEQTPKEHQHKVENLNDIPVGAPVYTRSRRNDVYGHIIIAGGWWKDAKGKRVRVFWSTDIKGYGEVHGVRLNSILTRWDHEVVGWASSLNGYALDFDK